MRHTAPSIAVLFCTLLACNASTKHQQGQATVSDPAETKQQSISAREASRLAEVQFRKYLPHILKTHSATLNLQESHTGDFTGDGLDDVAIYFVLNIRDGNGVGGVGLALYKNTGQGVKVIAGYEPGFLFTFQKISNGRIYLQQEEYDDDDARCCPSIKTEHVLTISGSKVFDASLR